MFSNLAFHKLQGCGNDFIVCNSKDLPEDYLSSSEKIRKLCDRNFGIGSDGLMVVGERGQQSILIEMFNPDGSAMGMCGNGIRCVVRYLCLTDAQFENQSDFEFKVFGRIIRCHSNTQGREVEVDMGPPSFSPEHIPINSQAPFLGEVLELDRLKIRGWALSMGNPHFVCFIESMDRKEAELLGSKIENHPFFPERTNVEFVSKVDSNSMELLVWERGVGLTMACGTGACAAVVIALKRDILSSPCNVHLPGGIVVVKWESKAENASVFLSGPVREVYSGSIVLENL